MFRALAVLTASASLAMGPAASAATHASSHKPAHTPAHGKSAHAQAAEGKSAGGKSGHGKSVQGKSAAHADATSSKSKLHHSAEAEAPAKGRKTHGGKAVASSRRHGKAVEAEEADAAPAPKGKHHGKTAPVEEAAAETDSKSAHGKHHGVEAVETETKASTHKSTHEWGAEAGGGGLIHADLKSTKACVAAHVRSHGRPKGAKGRAALQRECVKEVEAARRRAEEEAAIRSWSAPRGPLIYPGAMPRTASVSEPETPANPAPAVIVPTATADASTLAGVPGVPGAPPAAGDAATTPATPAQGVAVVQQQPAPQPASNGFLSGLLGHARRGPQRPPGEPAPTLAGLVGADETRLKTELGEPELMRAEGDGALWTYRLQGCALYVFLGRDAATSPWKVRGAQAGPLKRGGPIPDVDVCLKGKS